MTVHKPRVIRVGQKESDFAGITQKDVRTLQQFWELEEQLGIRKRPQDTLLEQIPPIELEPRTKRVSE